MAEMAETVVKRILASRNHFEVLDIPPVAVDVGTVTKLYRRLALKVHPDKCRHADGPKAFLRISEAHEVLSDPSGQRTYLGSVHSITRAAEAEKKAWFWQKREAAEARKAAEEAAAREAEEAEEREVRNAAKQDKKRERELRRQQAAAAAARKAAKEEAEVRAKEEETAVARDESRRRATNLKKARRRLRNAHAALQADADEAAATSEGTGNATDDVAWEKETTTSANCLLTDAEVELLCERLSEAELDVVLAALLIGDLAAVGAAAKATADAAAEAAAVTAAAASARASSAAAEVARAAALQWSEQERVALVKAAKKQGLTFVRVGGHANWEAVANFVHSSRPEVHKRDAARCRAEFRRLANEHQNGKAGENSVSGAEEKEKAAQEATKADSGSVAAPTKTPATGSAEECTPAAEWTAEQQKGLEAARPEKRSLRGARS